MVVTSRLEVSTRGNGDTIDITSQVAKALAVGKVKDGIAALFAVGSTVGLTTIEYEPGVVADLGRAFEGVAPASAEYQHHLRWGDDNGHSHVRAAMLGPSLVVPFVGGRLTLGTWQQIILVDFDTRPRRRELIVQIIGE